MSQSSATHCSVFNPLLLGPSLHLSHGVVLAPLTRFRASALNVPTPLNVTYYTQRAQSVPGTLLITEGTFIAAKATEVQYVPGIWNDEQIEGWRQVTNAVHDVGGFAFMQLFAPGRGGFASSGIPKADWEENGFEYVSSSALPLSGASYTPRAMSVPEIHEFIQLFGQAAHNAVHEAGLDGVEIHAAHGYLLDQFLQDTCNKRDDEYGGNIENRCRFVLEVVDEAVRRVGAERVGIRVSPWGTFQDMRMPNPIPTFTHLLTSLISKHPNLAYLHATEPRTSGSEDHVPTNSEESNDFLRRIWSNGPGADKRVFISAGGYTPSDAKDSLEKAQREGRREVIAFGRLFISNPDLPLRLRHGLPLASYNRQTFYTPESPIGYTDYPSAEIPRTQEGIVDSNLGETATCIQENCREASGGFIPTVGKQLTCNCEEV